MTDLHKPATPGPWNWSGDLVVTGDWEVPWVARVPFQHYADAAAIADLWQWIERAERYEEALRRIADGFVGRGALFTAADVLREEGRL